MAIDTVASVLAGIAGDDATLRRIRDHALATSAIGRIKAPARLTSPVVRAVVPAGRLTAAAVAEGSTKTVASGIFTSMQYSVKAISIIIPISNTLYQSSTDLQESVATQLAEYIAVGVDNEIINDPNSVFGASLKASASAASNAVTESAYLYDDLSSVFNKVQSTYYTVNGVVARRMEIPALQKPLASGVTANISVNNFYLPGAGGSSFGAQIFGVPAEFVDARVLDTATTTGKVRFVVGDFSQLEWGTWGDMQLAVSTEASTANYNAFTQNYTLVRAELYVGFAIINNGAFATLLEG